MNNRHSSRDQESSQISLTHLSIPCPVSVCPRSCFAAARCRAKPKKSRPHRKLSIGGAKPWMAQGGDRSDSRAACPDPEAPVVAEAQELRVLDQPAALVAPVVIDDGLHLVHQKLRRHSAESRQPMHPAHVSRPAWSGAPRTSATSAASSPAPRSARALCPTGSRKWAKSTGSHESALATNARQIGGRPVQKRANTFNSRTST